MSVPSWKRTESKALFIETADQLVDYTLTECLRFPKRLQPYLLLRTSELANEVYEYVEKGNVLRDKEQRIYFFNLAIASLNALQGQVNRLARRIKKTDKGYSIKDSVWVNWMELIEKESKLLDGLVKSEKSK